MTEPETTQENTDQSNNSSELIDNVLRVGFSTLSEIEEKLKAFRIMNQTSLKKRYILARETRYYPYTEESYIQKGKEISFSRIRDLKRELPSDTVLKTFQPDEGIVLISDITNNEGIYLSNELMWRLDSLQIRNYDRFMERTDSFSEFLELMKEQLFPKLIIIGYLPPDRIEMEKVNFSRVRKFDTFLRVFEVTHTVLKPQPYFPKIKQVVIDHTTGASGWSRFLAEVIREYTKPYYVEDY
jgi:hypothetical protein